MELSAIAIKEKAWMTLTDKKVRPSTHTDISTPTPCGVSI